MAAIFDSLSDPALIKQLHDGEVGVLPTDTVYGLVCIADNQKAVQRLYKLKKRKNKPGTIVAASIEQLVKLGIKRSYLKAVETFWPGAVSVVVPSSDAATLQLRQGLPTIAVRVPKNEKLQALLAKTGPLLTTSANPPDKPTADTIQMAEMYFRSDVDFYVDGGKLKNRKPSTVIRIVDDAVEVLRPGAVTIKANRAIK